MQPKNKTTSPPVYAAILILYFTHFTLVETKMLMEHLFVQETQERALL